MERPLSEPQSVDEVRSMLLDHSCWECLRGDRLLQFMEWALLLYGKVVDSSLIDHLSALYKHAIGNTDPEHRQLLLGSISLAAAERGLAACTMLPPLVVDNDRAVVATAMINYVALCHPDNVGLPYEFAELDNLFSRHTLICPGAALGGLINLGDRRFHPKIHEWKQFLTVDDIKSASNCQTANTTHGEVLFWLDWAEALVDQRDARSKSIFKFAASAVTSLGKNNPHLKVKDIERRFPASGFPKAVEVHMEWERTQYAKEMADRLYQIESRELPPKVFSAALRAWGL